MQKRAQLMIIGCAINSSYLAKALNVPQEVQPKNGHRMFSKRSFIATGIFLAAGLLYFLFKPLGLLWLLRTGGWDEWSKVLSGDVSDDGSVLYPVKLKWDFVDLLVAPKSSLESASANDIRIQVINPSKQSISVRCGRRNADNTGVDEDTLIHETTTDVTIDVYEGSLTELHSNWIPIHVQRVDGGNTIDVKLRIERKSGPYTQENIPFIVEAKWWSYGL